MPRLVYFFHRFAPLTASSFFDQRKIRKEGRGGQARRHREGAVPEPLNAIVLDPM